MDPITIGLGLLGGVGSALGGLFGANSANKAAAAAANENKRQYQDAQARLGLLMFGPDDWADFQTIVANKKPKTSYQFIPGGRGFGSFQKVVSDPVSAAKARFFGKYGTYQDAIQRAGGRYVSDTENLLGLEQDRTRNLDMLAQGMEGMGSDLEANEKARINRDSARQLAAMNQLTMGRLGYMGPSTMLGNQLRGNARDVGYQRDDAMLAAAKAATDRMMAARGQRLNLLNQRYGLMGTLQDTLAGRRRDSTMAPAQALQSMVSGEQFRPFQVDASAFSPYSPFASAMGGIAPALSMLGGMGLGGSVNPTTLARGTMLGNAATGGVNGFMGNLGLMGMLGK